MLFDGVVGIFYRGFTIEPEGEIESSSESQQGPNRNNGLCIDHGPGRLLFTTGIQDGYIKLQIVLSPETIAVDARWEDVVECSLTVDTPSLFVFEWAQEERHSIEVPLGDYRVRYCLLGLDNEDYDEYDEATGVPNQEYLIQLWPESIGPDAIIKETTNTAKYWNRHRNR